MRLTVSRDVRQAAVDLNSPDNERQMSSVGQAMRRAALGIMAAIGLSATTAAQAVTASVETIWNFTGNCEDCAIAANTATFEVTATLKTSGYVEGSSLDPNNIVYFRYEGSNLLDSYGVEGYGYPFIVGVDPLAGVDHVHGGLYWASGNLTSNGTQTLSLEFGDGLEFTMSTTGHWFTCGNKGAEYYAVPCSWMQNADNGGNGHFTVATANVVPEPGIAVLITASLVGLALATRRRRDRG